MQHPEFKVSLHPLSLTFLPFLPPIPSFVLHLSLSWLQDDVYTPYATWLVENDKFDEAQEGWLVVVVCVCSAGDGELLFGYHVQR